MAKYNRPNGKLFGSSASNIGVFGSGQTGETPTTSTDPNAINTLGTHWEDGWNGAVVSQAPYTAPFVEDMNAVNYVNSYNSAYLLQRGIPEYSATEEYQKDSLCTYNGEIWMCKLDNTVGQTPAEGTYWHLQGEVPIMNANEILVGAVGGTPTVVNTNGQGDVTASATGLDIKANTIVNADIKSNAGIEESKLALDYSTSALASTIGGHISDFGNPHSVTKAQVLSGDLIVNADVDNSAGIKESKLDLDYATDTLNTNIGNVSTALGNHTGNKNNPHETKISNLNDVTITNPQDGDVILYDLASDKYVNQQPPGGALSTLADTTITTPIADKSLVQYDLVNAKWVNSTEIPTKIEINDIAYVGTTPNGHTVDGNNNVTMLTTDNRWQVITATNGYDITLPSTGIKAGEVFVFEFTGGSSTTAFSTPFCILSGDSSNLGYAHIGYFKYFYRAKIDNPSTSSDWIFTYSLKIHYDKFGYWDTNSSATQSTWVTNSSGNLITVVPGVYQASFNFGFIGGSMGSDPWLAGVLKDGGTLATGRSDGRLARAVTLSMQRMGQSGGNISIGGTTIYWQECSPQCVSRMVINRSKSASYKMYYRIMNTASTTTVYFTGRVEYILIAPITTAI